MAFRLGVVALAVAGLGTSSEAHWSASAGTSLYVGRYLVCNEHPERDIRCAGPARARATWLADLSGTAPSRGGAASDELARRAAIYAVYFNLTDAIPQLRGHLAHVPQPIDRGTHREIEINGLRGEAAYALAHLGDAQSAAAIADAVLDFETTGHGFLWQDTLAALATIDPPRASRYAIDFLGRTSNWKLSMPGGGSKLLALDYIRREDARAALPLLERLAQQTASSLADDHAHCQFMATRIRLDDTVRAGVVKQLVGNYSGTWLPTCTEAVFQRLSPAQPDDAAALIRHLGRDDRGMDFGMANLAYQRILDLEVTTRPMTWGPKPDPAAVRARELLKRGLAMRSSWPHVADPKSPNYSLHFVVLHNAALAGLVDSAARNKLDAILDDPKDRGEAWLAALWMMRLDLRDNQDRVGDLLIRGLGQAQQQTTGVFEHIRTRVLDEFVAKYPDDPRWTALVLDLDRRMVLRPSDTAERALYHLSRHIPKLACETVTEAAASITAFEATEFGLLALTALGDRCRPALQQLADNSNATPQARGSALEILGALGDPQLAQRIERAAKSGAWRPAVERARVWLRGRR